MERIYKLTPVGRIVQGSLFEPRTKNLEGQLLDNPVYFFALAIQKTDPAMQTLWGEIWNYGQQARPDAAARPDFSWKVVDGDDPAHSGKEGFAGCYVLRLSSQFAPKITKVVNGQRQEITEPTMCKRGDFVRAQISIAPNDSRTNPGIYLSHQQVEHCGYGEEIVSGPSADEVFADPVQLPPGASQTPIAGGTMPATPGATGAPGMPPAAAPPAAAPPAAAPPAAAPPAAAPPTGAPGMPPAAAPPAAAPPTGAPGAPGAPGMPPAAAAPAPAPDILTPPVKKMLPAAQFTYDQYIAAGWNDDQLIAAGYMAA